MDSDNNHEMEIEVDNNNLIFKCIHCEDYVIVAITELNCCIFRHGTYKSNMQQVNPHAPQSECNRLSENGLVYGCCKPFRIHKKDGNYYVEKCGYI